MIGSIKGILILKTDKYILVEANGVGYKIAVSPDNLFKLEKNKEIFLFIHTHVREDAFDLYGFTTIQELNFFEMLLNVSGIGPRSALAILGIATIDTLKRAISTGDVSYLTKISGIGKKTAEKIVIELRDKLKEHADTENSGANLREELDALEALKSLGYSQNEARDALKEVGEGNTNTRIKQALKILANK